MTTRHGIQQLRDGHVPCSPYQTWGKFGRLFPTLPPHEPDPRDLEALGLKNGPMDEGSDDFRPDSRTIPAGFTFLGQLIDHDITFDPTSSLERQNDPTAIRNFRTPLLELDCVYGAGPGANPYLYDQTNPDKLLIGTSENPDDLPRNRQGTALIGDPRNDENLIVSQLQLAFLKLHNAVVDDLRERGVPAGKVFGEAQRLVRWHYQWLVVHEFLPLTIGQHMVDNILGEGLRFYRPGQEPFIPVEFSVAAYRFGHSQVRAVYRINRETIEALFDLPFFAPIRPEQKIDWTNFFHISSGHPPQFSRKIDAKLTQTLLDLQPPIVPPGIPPANRSLAIRNLKRGATFALPAGQTVAKAMGLEPLSDEALGLTDVDFPGKGFRGEAPLWFYILKEAEVQTAGETLGEVGGRIVGEVLLGLLIADPLSYFNLDPRWQPDPVIAPNGQFIDLLKFAGVVPVKSPSKAAPTPTVVERKTTLETPATVPSPPKASQALATKQLSGQPRLAEIEISSVETEGWSNFVVQNQPFDIRLTLDLSETDVPLHASLGYKATVYAKPVGSGLSQIVAHAFDTLTVSETIFAIDLSSEGLEAGLYRLEAVVILGLLPDGPKLTSLLEGNLLQVN